MKTKGISQEALKLIACTVMLLDHVGATLYPSGTLRMIGRMAFPIFAFLLCEGIVHTRNPGKYLLRMGIGMLLAEIPFDLLFYNKLTFEHQSVMVTLILVLAMGLCMEKIPNRFLRLPVILPFAFLAELLQTDYGAAGVAMAAVFLLTRDLPGKHLLQLLGIALVNYLMDSTRVNVFGIRLPVQMLSLFAFIPIWLYRGGKAVSNRAVQWLFYLFYPVHMTLLLVLMQFQ